MIAKAKWLCIKVSRWMKSMMPFSFYGSSFFDRQYFENGVNSKKSGYAGYENKKFSVVAKDLVKQFKPKSVLDIGCAKGFLVEELLKNKVIAKGIDISEYAVNSSKVNEHLFVGPSTKIPFKENEFDLVVSFDLMEHLNRRQIKKTVQEMARVSSKNVLFGITTDKYFDKIHITMKDILWWEQEICKHSSLKRFEMQIPKGRWFVDQEYLVFQK